MTNTTLWTVHPKIVRDTLNSATDQALEIHRLEGELICLLKEIDKRRFYVRYGFYSLRGFCNKGLKFTRTQSQRLVTQVRRSKYEVPDLEEREKQRLLNF